MTKNGGLMFVGRENELKILKGSIFIMKPNKLQNYPMWIVFHH